MNYKGFSLHLPKTDFSEVVFGNNCCGYSMGVKIDLPHVCSICGEENCKHLNNEKKKNKITKFKFIGGK